LSDFSFEIDTAERMSLYSEICPLMALMKQPNHSFLIHFKFRYEVSDKFG
jgi:hypothetical protein